MLKLKNFRKPDVLYYYKHFHTLVALYRKYLESQKTKFVWKKLFNMYSIGPTNRRGVVGQLVSLTADSFFSIIPNYL